jgi:hypothetical protein
MPFAFVQSTSGAQANSATVPAAAFASANTAGNILIAIATGASTATSITDTANNTWTMRGTTQNGGTGISAIFTVIGCKGSANTPTAHFSGAGTNWVTLVEYSVPPGTITLDATIGQANSANVPVALESVTASFNSGVNPYLIFISNAGHASTDTFTPGNSFTTDLKAAAGAATDSADYFSHKQGVGSGSQTGSVTTSNARDWNAYVLAFYAASGNFRCLLGVGT